MRPTAPAPCALARYAGTVPGASTRRLVLPRRSRGRQLVIVTLERDGAKADQAERRSASTASTRRLPSASSRSRACRAAVGGGLDGLRRHEQPLRDRLVGVGPRPSPPTHRTPAP